ncbi:hypothetical protein CBR_g39596 [Chara braunii]|uniref:MBD domain-containing protein n=1 Tax=Chara braunii TaxID=69332 RepID=A0A388K183_CHABU|nr:hypothetical protein CBR_g39596 [Chara braunii]|eukprot:GBG63812.1 hypothetical protein CBR_g39596 [Chara braunii]
MGEIPHPLAGKSGLGRPFAPPGWRWKAGQRMTDMYFYAPDGKAFRSRKSVVEHLEKEGLNHLLPEFHFRCTIADLEEYYIKVGRMVRRQPVVLSSSSPGGGHHSSAAAAAAAAAANQVPIKIVEVDENEDEATPPRSNDSPRDHFSQGTKRKFSAALVCDEGPAAADPPGSDLALPQKAFPRARAGGVSGASTTKQQRVAVGNLQHAAVGGLPRKDGPAWAGAGGRPAASGSGVGGAVDHRDGQRFTRHHSRFGQDSSTAVARAAAAGVGRKSGVSAGQGQNRQAVGGVGGGGGGGAQKTGLQSLSESEDLQDRQRNNGQVAGGRKKVVVRYKGSGVVRNSRVGVEFASGSEGLAVNRKRGVFRNAGLHPADTVDGREAMDMDEGKGEGEVGTGEEEEEEEDTTEEGSVDVRSVEEMGLKELVLLPKKWKCVLEDSPFIDRLMMEAKSMKEVRTGAKKGAFNECRGILLRKNLTRRMLAVVPTGLLRTFAFLLRNEEPKITVDRAKLMALCVRWACKGRNYWCALEAGGHKLPEKWKKAAAERTVGVGGSGGGGDKKKTIAAICDCSRCAADSNFCRGCMCVECGTIIRPGEDWRALFCERIVRSAPLDGRCGHWIHLKCAVQTRMMMMIQQGKRASNSVRIDGAKGAPGQDEGGRCGQLKECSLGATAGGDESGASATAAAHTSVAAAAAPPGGASAAASGAAAAACSACAGEYSVERFLIARLRNAMEAEAPLLAERHLSSAVLALRLMSLSSKDQLQIWGEMQFIQIQEHIETAWKTAAQGKLSELKSAELAAVIKAVARSLEKAPCENSGSIRGQSSSPEQQQEGLKAPAEEGQAAPAAAAADEKAECSSESEGQGDGTEGLPKAAATVMAVKKAERELQRAAAKARADTECWTKARQALDLQQLSVQRAISDMKEARETARLCRNAGKESLVVLRTKRRELDVVKQQLSDVAWDDKTLGALQTRAGLELQRLGLLQMDVLETQGLLAGSDAERCSGEGGEGDEDSSSKQDAAPSSADLPSEPDSTPGGSGAGSGPRANAENGHEQPGSGAENGAGAENAHSQEQEQANLEDDLDARLGLALGKFSEHLEQLKSLFEKIELMQAI